MKTTLQDKIFFTSLLDEEFDTCVDFGCADGAVLQELQAFYPNSVCYGIDKDAEMRKLANEKIANGKIVSSLSDVCVEGKSILCLNSVLHEIYSYSSSKKIDEFWDEVFSKGFDYISIRDMSIRDMLPEKTINYQSAQYDVNCLMKYANGKQLREHEKIFGDITQNKSLIHFLMKYKYVENWEREVKENYFALYFEDLLSLIPDNYETIYMKNFALPYTKEQVLNDFGVLIQDNTHAKIILRKKNVAHN